MKNKIYKVTFGYKDALIYDGVNVLASNAKDAIARADKKKLSSWYVTSVELLAAADFWRHNRYKQQRSEGA